MDAEMLSVMDEILNVTDLPGLDGESVEVYKPLVLTEVESNPKNRTEDLESDYVDVRQNLHQQQQMMFDAAKILLETAKNADSPRHIQAFTQLMAQMSVTNEKILKVHREMKDITSEQIGTSKPTGDAASPVNIDKAQIFIGSTADLMAEVGDQFEAKQRQLDVVGEQ